MAHLKISTTSVPPKIDVPVDQSAKTRSASVSTELSSSLENANSFLAVIVQTARCVPVAVAAILANAGVIPRVHWTTSDACKQRCQSDQLVVEDSNA